MAEGADEMNCPECGAELEAGTVDLNTIGWCCSKCGIKIYKKKSELDRVIEKWEPIIKEMAEQSERDFYELSKIIFTVAIQDAYKLADSIGWKE